MNRDVKFLNNELEDKKKNQMERKNTIAKMKNTLEVINNRLNDTKGVDQQTGRQYQKSLMLIKGKEE